MDLGAPESAHQNDYENGNIQAVSNIHSVERNSGPHSAASLHSGLKETEKQSPVLIIVMGVSGCGKSTLGAALAASMGVPFVDADELHPQSNIDKMSHGVPLTDEDRAPWLTIVRTTAERICTEECEHLTHSELTQCNKKGVVVGCSALKRAYRAVLRGETHILPTSPDHPQASPDSLTSSNSAAMLTFFVFIEGSRSDLLARMESRQGHFMKADMLDSQLKTLENPVGENGVVKVDLEDSTEEQVIRVREGLRVWGLDV